MNNSWFEVKAKYTKQLDDGRLKRVTEPYLVDAISFTDAEARIYEEVGESVKGEFIVVSIARKEFSDIFAYEDSDVWYQAKAKFETLDADSGKSKSVGHNYLVSASNVEQANERIKDALKDYVVSSEITSVSLSKIVEVLPYTSKE